MDAEFDKETPSIPAIKNGELVRRDHQRFSADIDHLLKEAEALRLTYMKRHQARNNTALSLGLIFMLLGAGALGWYLLMHGDLVRAVGSMALAIVVPLFLNLRGNAPIKKYRAEYKTKFLPQMAKALGGFEFHPARGISAKILSKAGVLPQHDIYSSEDCFMGQYKGVKVIFSEAHLFKKKRNEAVFRGVFVLLETPTDIIEGHTILTANKDMFRRWRTTRWAKLQDVKVHTENVEWDRFEIVSDKPEAAQRLVNEKLLKELSEAADIFDQSPLTAVLFKGKFIFMMIPYARDMFEPSSIHIPVATRQHALQCKREIEQILEVIDVFDLYKNAA